MRTYERTHPWLTFKLNLSRSSHRLWIALGEAQSKCEHIAGVPLRRSAAEALHRLYLAKGVLATTAIEGNTLSEEEVLQHLDGKLDLPPSKEYLAQEVDNIVSACNQIWLDPGELSTRRIKDLNSLVLRGLNLEKHVGPGTIRVDSVGVAGYRGAPAQDCQYLLDRLCDWLNSADFHPADGMGIVYGVIQAIVAHMYLAWIHPFGDGNGRTARLMEYQILIEAGVPSPAAHLLSNHYNQTRAEYYRQLDRASKSGGDFLPFIEYAVLGFVEGLRAQLQYIREQQWDIAWRDFVYENYRDRNSSADIRQRHLVLDLSSSGRAVPMTSIPELTPRLAATYARISSKTLSRDVKALEEEDLIVRTDNGVKANRELILAFLPLRRSPDA